MDRRYRDLQRLAKRYGYDISFEKRRTHGRLVRPGYPDIIVSVSLKNVDHWLKNVERDLKNTLTASDASA